MGTAALANILLFSDDPEGGGVSQYNHAVLCALAARGYRVTCVQSRADNPLIRRQAEMGVQHAWLDFDTNQDFRRTLTHSADGERMLREHGPDLVVFSNGCPLSHFAAKQAAIRLRIPFVVVEGFASSYLADKFHERLDELSEHYARAEAVIAVSQENLHLLQRRFRLSRGLGQVICYGRPAAYFQPPDPATRARLRQEWEVPPDAVLCLTVARLDPIKGYQYQVGALRQLRETPAWSRLYFAWAGSGSVTAQIAEDVRRQGVGDHVKLLGRRWDVPDVMAAADVYVHPSEAEGMPLAVMEAMARGLPVAATAVSGIPEELGPTGQLLPPPLGNAEATVAGLAATLRQWAEDAPLRQAAGAACRERAQALFTEERMLAQTLQVLDGALLPVGDYVSPGLAVVRPDRYFPRLKIGARGTSPSPWLRQHVAHNWYVDERFPQVGWLSRDEAHILHHSARQFQGRRGLAIGSFPGWSTCHLALAGLDVDAVDPLLARPEFRERVLTSLRAARLADHVRLHGAASPTAVEELARPEQRRWSLLYREGDPEGDAPLRDAQVCAEFADDDALILVHNLAAPAVARGLDYLRDRGWQTRIYHTMQIMGAAWRGRAQAIAHQPDPRVVWDVPEHLRRHV